MSFPEEATHPRYYGEGYPDWPGRASNKEGESWTSIAGLASESIRQSCAMRLRSRRMVVAGTFAILARSTPAAVARLVAPSGRALPLAPRQSGTAASTIDLAAIAAAEDRKSLL